MDLSKNGILMTTVVDGVAVLSFERGCLREENEILITLGSLGRYISGKKDLKILLDLQNVEYLSSAGLGQLVGLLKRSKANGGEFKLCSLQDPIRELFDIMQLSMIFEIFPNQEEALDAFRRQAAENPA